MDDLARMRCRCQCDLSLIKPKCVGRSAGDAWNELKSLCSRTKVRDRRGIAERRDLAAFAVYDGEVSGMNGLDRLAANDIGQDLSSHIIYFVAASIAFAFSRAASVTRSPASILAISSMRWSGPSSRTLTAVALPLISFSTTKCRSARLAICGW